MNKLIRWYENTFLYEPKIGVIGNILIVIAVIPMMFMQFYVIGYFFYIILSQSFQ